MLYLCRCQAYVYATPMQDSPFCCGDPKKGKVGSQDYSRTFMANMPEMEAGE